MSEGLTVKELKKWLTQLMKEGHGDDPVIMEGCDCEAPCTDITIQRAGWGDYVYLER